MISAGVNSRGKVEVPIGNVATPDGDLEVTGVLKEAEGLSKTAAYPGVSGGEELRVELSCAFRDPRRPCRRLFSPRSRPSGARPTGTVLVGKRSRLVSERRGCHSRSRTSVARSGH